MANYLPFSSRALIASHGLGSRGGGARLGGEVELAGSGPDIAIGCGAAEEGERRERMLRLVTGAIKQAGERDGLTAFREEMRRLSQQPSDRDTAAALSYFLVHERLKLDKPVARS